MTGESLAAPGGLLRPHGYGDAIRLHREPAGESVAPLVELYWSVAWQLAPGERRTQETLPYPAVHLVVEDGDAIVYGVPQEKFVRTLAGAGWVLGIKFQPGGFRPLLGSSVSGLRGRVVRAADVLDVDVRRLVAAVHAADGPVARSAAAEAWLRALALAPDPLVGQATRAVNAIAADPRLSGVDETARRLGTSSRSLQRLFTDYVGVGLKWTVRRFRMHEAAAQAAAGAVDWAGLARELGYYDQAHFVRDFTAAVGMPPARYAADCER